MSESLSGSVVWWWSYTCTCTLMCVLCMLVAVHYHMLSGYGYTRLRCSSDYNGEPQVSILLNSGLLFWLEYDAVFWR